MLKRIDCTNLDCPTPVLITKDALAEFDEGILEVEVNSLSSIGNVLRFAQSQGLYASSKKEGDVTVISIVKGYECGIELPDGTHSSDRSFWTLITGAVVAAILASTCCLGPLLFLVFGISAGSLSFLQVLAPYHDYFALVAVGVVGYLWWDYLFRRRKKPVCEGSLCKNYLLYLNIGTAFVAILSTYPYWVNYLLGD